MTALVFDRIGFETEASQTVPTSSKCPREEEFRAALDRYMADYIACQKRRISGVIQPLGTAQAVLLAIEGRALAIRYAGDIKIILCPFVGGIEQ